MMRTGKSLITSSTGRIGDGYKQKKGRKGYPPPAFLFVNLFLSDFLHQNQHPKYDMAHADNSGFVGTI